MRKFHGNGGKSDLVKNSERGVKQPVMVGGTVADGADPRGDLRVLSRSRASSGVMGDGCMDGIRFSWVGGEGDLGFVLVSGNSYQS